MYKKYTPKNNLTVACLLSFIMLFTATLLSAQTKYTFTSLAEKGSLEVLNRKATIVKEGSLIFLKLSQDKGEGLVWLPESKFQNGILSVRMRGKNVVQQSFVGIAFNGQNDSTFEAVYCRPFNFLATDSVRKIHAIQYIAHPIYTWKKLREERNAEFEKEIINPPNPDSWFTLTIRVDSDTVSAFIDSNKTPSLVVKRLTKDSAGKIGLFVGDNSGGDFEIMEVKTTKAKQR